MVISLRQDPKRGKHFLNTITLTKAYKQFYSVLFKLNSTYIIQFHYLAEVCEKYFSQFLYNMNIKRTLHLIHF